MHVIEFKEDGTAECLHTDEIPLGELGSLRMERASSIEWNNRLQYWQVYIKDAHGLGVVKYSSPSREECLIWERQYFNEMILRR